MMLSNRKKLIGLVLLAVSLMAALEAITHSQFYKDLEWLNMDNHQH